MSAKNKLRIPPDHTVGLHVHLDDWWKGKTFDYFQRLPPEIRQMIWEESIPARYINPRPRGSVSIPGPPTAARVCRESRSTALRLGAPYGIDQDNKKGNSAWFMPTKDIILYEGPPRAFTNRTCAASAWNAVQKVVLRVGSTFPPSERARFQRVVRLPQLKEIFIVPTGQRYDRKLADSKKWHRRIRRGIFGKDTYQLVDLDDHAQVTRFTRLLYKHNDSFNGGWRLDLAVVDSDDSREGRSPQVKFRDLVVDLFQKSWLTGNGISFSTLDNGTVNKTEDVELALKNMPTIRFAYVFFDPADEIPFEEHRKLRYQGSRKAYRPKYIFNQEFKLWQKFVVE